MESIEYIKQQGLGHKVDRLYIHWDITTQCEYKCSYCYARKEYEDKWNRPGIWKKQLNVIDALKESTLPIFLGLLGGEPTSHYKYFELLDNLEQIILVNNDSRLYITTNGNKTNEFFLKHKKVNKQFYVLFSLHPEYVDDTTFNQFKNNIRIMLEKGYRVKVNVMLHPSKQYWGFLRTAILSLNTLDIEVHPHYIYSDAHNSVLYSKDFYEFFEEAIKTKEPEFIFETDDDIYLLTDQDIFKNKYNKFKDWNCWNNNYEIDLDCRINQFCFEDKKDIALDYFKNISSIVSKKCPHEYCSCDGLLKIKKEK